MSDEKPKRKKSKGFTLVLFRVGEVLHQTMEEVEDYLNNDIEIIKVEPIEVHRIKNNCPTMYDIYFAGMSRDTTYWDVDKVFQLKKNGEEGKWVWGGMYSNRSKGTCTQCDEAIKGERASEDNPDGYIIFERQKFCDKSCLAEFCLK
jgi:hypothetical protein